MTFGNTEPDIALRDERGLMMKKGAYIIVCLVCFLVLLAGGVAVVQQSSSLEFAFDKRGQYTGFNGIPSRYTPEMAQNAGYYVMSDSEVVANGGLWDDFLAASSQGKNTSLRMAKFYSEYGSSPFFADLFYNEGYYYLFDSSAKDLSGKPFKHLLTLKGKFGNPLRDSGVVVLANDNSLTFDLIMSGMVSSNLEYIKSIPEYQLIMFLI